MMETIWITIACAEGAIILFLGGLIAKAIFKMSDSIQGLTKALTEFVKKDDCKTDMGEHCSKIDSLEYRIDKNEKALAELKAKAEIWHKD
jgi:hypothetical protein